ncbi:MAG: hypothetical protein K1X54_01030 [Flavobacteriales bacterium]|nr:hypothetical protein [Flavobacteriales bacterium]
MKKIIWISGLLIIAIVTGFLQENLKVNVNYILETGDKINGFFNQTPEVKRDWLQQVKIDAPYDYYHNHRRLEFLLNFTRSQLVIAKWVITVFFVALFMILNSTIIFLVTSNTSLRKWTIRLYIAFFLLSFLVYIFGVITGSGTQAYGISRKVVGGLQSLVPLMILLPGYWINRTYFPEKNEKP